MRFYVYLLLHPEKSNLPVYVGKGKEDRVKVHGWEGENHSNRTLRSYMARKGGPLDHVIVFETDDEQQAFNCERCLIRILGRLDTKTGSLANFTDGGEGTSGLKRTVEHTAKIVAANQGRKRTGVALENIRRGNRNKPKPGPEFGRIMSEVAKRTWAKKREQLQ